MLPPYSSGHCWMVHKLGEIKKGQRSTGAVGAVVKAVDYKAEEHGFESHQGH